MLIVQHARALILVNLIQILVILRQAHFGVGNVAHHAVHGLRLAVLSASAHGVGQELAGVIHTPSGSVNNAHRRVQVDAQQASVHLMVQVHAVGGVVILVTLRRRRPMIFDFEFDYGFGYSCCYSNSYSSGAAPVGVRLGSVDSVDSAGSTIRTSSGRRQCFKVKDSGSDLGTPNGFKSTSLKRGWRGSCCCVAVDALQPKAKLKLKLKVKLSLTLRTLRLRQKAV